MYPDIERRAASRKSAPQCAHGAVDRTAPRVETGSLLKAEATDRSPLLGRLGLREPLANPTALL